MSSLQIHRSLGMLMEMLVDRGYEMPCSTTSINEKSIRYDISYEDFVLSTKELDMDEICRYANIIVKGKRDMMIYWCVILGSSVIENIQLIMRSLGIRRCILVYIDKITSYASTSIKNMSVLKMYIEPFHISSLQYNPTKHILVPKHELCSALEKEEILKSYGITVDNLPIISINDPIVRWLGYKKGNVIKITRPSETMKSDTLEYKYIVYRVVR